ncbi:unnamed protein product, partial [Taenia asiatica]|uniref:Aspartyltransferase n=1 Tax=Taenia asiatica TaxID=60517 RepID=A0A0R3VYM1_TAEAS
PQQQQRQQQQEHQHLRSGGGSGSSTQPPPQPQPQPQPQLPQASASAPAPSRGAISLQETEALSELIRLIVQHRSPQSTSGHHHHLQHIVEALGILVTIPPSFLHRHPDGYSRNECHPQMSEFDNKLAAFLASTLVRAEGRGMLGCQVWMVRRAPLP